MLAHLSSLAAVIPTFMSILALVLFIERTKKLAYATIALSMLAVILAPTLNVAALVACTSCLAGVWFINYLRTHFDLRFNLIARQ
ncbi:MAG: hypothetical protein K0S11_355 [Gammaproteobacteria bacterium]|jgi:hypothetical protein|nr:hypothetical protein [Gammaproteobacteria bacterium]